MPIDSDPDGPAHARETAATRDGRAAPDGQTAQDGHAGPGRQRGRETTDRADTARGATGTLNPDTPDLRERQAAEWERYHRVVDATFAATARERWAAAAQEQRAGWEDHKERYPERVRATAHTQPDGSWVGDGNRRLSPEQNAEATKCCADLRDEADQVVLPAMQRIEAADPNRRLAGLEHMLKGEDRLKEKIADYLRAPGVTVRRAVDMVPDPVRFTLQYDAGRYSDGVLADVERIKSEGFELIKLKNLWQADQYKGVNSQWRRSGSGTRVEVQFHTPESLEAKELTHEAYERLRRPEAETSPTERDELKQFQRGVNALLATPPGTNRIRDFPE